MAATREDVDRWIQYAKENKTPYIISVCDSWDYDDYPVYCNTYKELVDQYIIHNGKNMQRINEIIRIKSDGTVEEGLRLSDIKLWEKL